MHGVGYAGLIEARPLAGDCPGSIGLAGSAGSQCGAQCGMMTGRCGGFLLLCLAGASGRAGGLPPGRLLNCTALAFVRHARTVLLTLARSLCWGGGPGYCATAGACSQQGDLLEESGFVLLSRTDKGYAQASARGDLPGNNQAGGRTRLFSSSVQNATRAHVFDMMYTENAGRVRVL